MNTLNWDRVHPRIAGHRDFARLKKEGFRFTAVSKTLTISALAGSGTVPVDFAAGGIVLGMGASVVDPTAHSAVPLSLVEIGIDYPTSDGSIIVGPKSSLAALLGINGDGQFPSVEIIVVRGGTLNVSAQSLYNGPAQIDLVFGTMQPRS